MYAGECLRDLTWKGNGESIIDSPHFYDFFQ